MITSGRDDEEFTEYDLACANLVLNITEVILLACILAGVIWLVWGS
jgi:hypothetical protein